MVEGGGVLARFASRTRPAPHGPYRRPEGSVAGFKWAPPSPPTLILKYFPEYRITRLGASQKHPEVDPKTIP